MMEHRTQLHIETDGHNMAKIRAISAEAAEMDGPALIDLAGWHTQGQGRLAALSGIQPGRITELKRGKRPTKAERAAINWAIARSNGL